MPFVSLPFLCFVYWITTASRVQCQKSWKCKDNSCAGHVASVPFPESASSLTLWIAPDDVVVSEVPDGNPIPCPESDLKATVAIALRLTSNRVILRPFCIEGLILYKTRISAMVNPNGPTYCALIISSANELRIGDTTFDHSECINNTVTTSGATTADSTAAVVIRPKMSRLDSQTMLYNLTFRGQLPFVTVLLSPPSWTETLQLAGPTFSGLHGRITGMRFLALLVAGRMTLANFTSMTTVILQDPAAGLDRSVITTPNVPLEDLWQDMDAWVLMRLHRSSDPSMLPQKCPSMIPPTPHAKTLIAIGFSLAGLLALCVIILLVHSCQSTEGQALAPYRTPLTTTTNTTTTTTGTRKES